MARSYRQPILRDRPRNYKKSSLYWRTVRSVINQAVRGFKYLWQHQDELDYLDEEDLWGTGDKGLEDSLPHPKQIVNDYDREDWVMDYRFWGDKYKKERIKYSRK